MLAKPKNSLRFKVKATIAALKLYSLSSKNVIRNSITRATLFKNVSVTCKMMETFK
jgi:hypothetical protein